VSQADSLPRPLLEVRDIDVDFRTRNGTVSAVSGVGFSVEQGETFSIVGESGSGKSSLAKAILGLVEPSRGDIVFDGKSLSGLNARAWRDLRPHIQMIFQDPAGSLNPRRTVRRIVAEGLEIWPDRIEEPVEESVRVLLGEVGLNVTVVGDRRPTELSGGQCQRIALARALALKPRLMVCDEPVSALDVSVQAQVLNLLRRMKRTHGLTMIFISHDLSVVKNISDRILVMHLGARCELASVDRLFDSPVHPYTKLLIESAPSIRRQARAPGPRTATEPTDMPSPLAPPSGCRFRTRCPLATGLCAEEVPAFRELRSGHWVACHHAELPD
jgi:peptide/nickel transport system ATP-binding protein